MRPVILAFLLSRAALLLALLLAPPLVRWPGVGPVSLDWKDVDGGGRARSWLHHPAAWLDAWVRNDGTYYLEIAALGYAKPASDRFVKEGFLPGYPWLVRGAARAFAGLGLGSGGGPGNAVLPFLAAGILVSNAALLAAAAALVALGRRLGGPETGTRAGVFLCVSPFSFLLSCHLGEALFLALAAGGFLAADRGRFLLAGALGAAAAATKVLGVALALPLLLLALRRGGGEDRRLERALPALLVPLGLAVALVALGRATGDPWIYFKVQRHFGHEDFPTLDGFRELFVLRTYSPFEPARNALNAGLALVLGALAVLQIRDTVRGRLPFAWLFVTVPLLALPLLAGHILSLPRYALVIFPLYLVVAARLPGGRRGALLAALSILAQAALFLSWEAHQPVII